MGIQQKILITFSIGERGKYTTMLATAQVGLYVDLMGESDIARGKTRGVLSLP